MPPGSSNFASMLVASVLYGFSLLMFMMTLYTLSQRSPSRKTNKVTFVIALILFVCSTMHMSLTAYVAAREFLHQELFAFVKLSIKQCRGVMYTLETILADGVVIYRAWIAYNRNIRALIAPLFLWFAVVATGIGTAVQLSRAYFDPVTQRAGQTYLNWFTSLAATSLACNVVATGILVRRIWVVNNAARPFRLGQSRLRRILRILMDSAMLYSFALVIQLIFISLNTAGAFILVNILPQIIAICFYMVIIRMAYLNDSNQSSSTPFTLPSIIINDEEPRRSLSNVTAIRLTRHTPPEEANNNTANVQFSKTPGRTDDRDYSEFPASLDYQSSRGKPAGGQYGAAVAQALP